MNARLPLLAALFVVVLAAGLRVQQAQLRHSLWSDEAQEIGIIRSSPDLAAVVEKLNRDGHPPLNSVIEWICYRAFGEDFLLGRWLQVLWGTLAVTLVIVIAWRWFDWRCALLTGLIAAASPFLLHYSTELRSYALFSCIAPLYGLAYLRYLDRRDVRSALLWGAAAALFAYGHYFAFFIILAGGFHALALDRTRRGFLQVVAAGAAFLAVFAPWLPSFFGQLQHNAQPWGVPDKDPRAILRALNNPLGWPATWILLFSLVAGWFLVRRAARERLTFHALVVAGLGGALLAWIFQWFRGVYYARYLIAHTMLLLPAACLYWSRMGTIGDAIVWRGLRTGRLYRMPARWHAIAGIALLVALVPMTARHRERWIGKPISASATVAARIEALERAGDRIEVTPSWDLLALAYHYDGALRASSYPYDDAPAWFDHTDRPAELRDTAAIDRYAKKLAQHLDDGGRVWLVARGSFPTDRETVLDPRTKSKNPSPHNEAVLALHLKILRTLYAHGTVKYQWDCPPGMFRHSADLFRFDPKERNTEDLSDE
ncbi:MAG: glycosyltransferase family 39 protein [Planctomycetota bacterium]|jgi:hypothetical protein